MFPRKIKVQPAPKLFFADIDLLVFLITAAKILLLWLFSLIFYDFSKFLKLAVSVPRGRAIAKNGASWPLTSSKVFWGERMRTCDNVIQNRCRMQVRCVAGRSRSAAGWQERAILFLRYLCIDGTRPETRKRRKKCADLCEVWPKQGAIEQFFDLGFAATVKT